MATAIAEHKLLLRGEAVLVGVSGGLDSMVLLEVLFRLARQHELKLAVAHFNHQLRGESSDADEALVRRTARKLKLKLFAARGDVRGCAREQQVSLEMAARTLRHDFLARTAAAEGFRRVALAHHADDQVELFLLRLVRGAGPEGLSGMKWVGVSPANPEIKLVRPLLTCAKAELGAYAFDQRVAFREDRTNACTDMLRNRIRHKLLPLLRKSYQPAFDVVVTRLMEILRAEDEVVREIAAEALARTKQARNAPAVFNGLPRAVQRRLLRSQLVRLGIAPEFDVVEGIRLRADKPMTVTRSGVDGSSSVLISRTHAGSIELQSYGRQRFPSKTARLELKGRAGQVNFGNMKIRWRMGLVGSKLGQIGPRSGYECFDADKVGREIIMRYWQPGDRFQPIGTGSPVKLQDIFTNEKVPRERRHELILATTAAGEVFWVEDLRIAEQFKLTTQTGRCLHWRWHGL